MKKCNTFISLRQQLITKNMIKNTVYLIFFIAFLSNSCKQSTEIATLYETNKSKVYDTAMVVSPHPLASEIGRNILKKGGNAVDAAIAVQFAIAVVYPRAGNIGGGGFMLIRNQDGSTKALDYREKAPAAAYRNMYLDSMGNVIPNLSISGHLAAGVPGTIDGLWQAHQQLGTLPWKDLVQPAYELAKNGFKVTVTEAERLTNLYEQVKKYSTQPNPFSQQPLWKEGELLVQPELAATLARIMEQGRDGFYTGTTADLVVAEMERGKGIISKQDLADYKAQWRVPLEKPYKDFNIIAMPPSSSGGIALIQMLKMIEPYPIGEYGFHTPQSVHLMVEAERRAFADRAVHVGDSDFYDVPTEMLLDSAYLVERMKDFHPQRPSPSDSLAAGDLEVLLESFETTHTSIVDAQGNAVAVTTTLNSNYGCKVVVGGAGFFLNNEMDDFSAKPGVQNQFGLVGAEANAIAPGKRMLSSMTPTIIEKNGELFLVLGAPGGSTIITAVFQTFVNVAEFGMDLNDAVQAGRFHHQWKPDEIWIEQASFPTATQDSLAKVGYKFKDVKRMAVIKAIQRLPNGKLHGVGDHRNPDDDVKGY